MSEQQQAASPTQQSDRLSRGRRRLSKVCTKVKSAFKDKDGAAQRASTSTPIAGAAALASPTQASAPQQTAAEQKPKDAATSGKQRAGVDAEARLQRIKAVLEKYDHLISEDEGEVPADIAITDRRPAREEPYERVQKKIRVRVKYTCHQCQTVFGNLKSCVSCQHKRCAECTRYPPKKRRPKVEETGEAGAAAGGGAAAAAAAAAEPPSTKDNQ